LQLQMQTHERFVRDYLSKVIGTALDDLWAITCGLCSERVDARWIRREVEAIEATSVARRVRGLTWDRVTAAALPAGSLLELEHLTRVLAEEDRRFLDEAKQTLRRGVEKLRNWARGLTQVADRMWVVDLPMVPGLQNRTLRRLNRLLVKARLRQVLSRLRISRPVVLTTLPYVGWITEGLPRRALVYYCTDDYSHWPSADRETPQQAERDLLDEADLARASDIGNVEDADSAEAFTTDVVGDALSAAVEPPTRLLDGHNEQVADHRYVALAPGADHRADLDRNAVGPEPVAVEAMVIADEQGVAAERHVGLGEAQQR
jgi:hypothetical protein